MIASTLAFTKVLPQVNASLALANLGEMTEDDLQQIRRERLKAWLDSNGGLAKVSEHRRLKPSYQSYLSQITNGYSIGARGARTCEQRLGMPTGWLDEHGATADESLVTMSAGADDLTSAVATVAKALQNMEADRRSELVKVFGMLADYPDEPDYSERLTKLLKGGGPQAAARGKQRRAA